MTIELPSIVLTQYFVLGLLLLGVAGFFHRVALSGKKNWDKAFQPVEPSLKASSSAMTGVGAAIAGMFKWLFGWALVIVFGFLGVDYLFFEGTLSHGLIDSVRQTLGI